MARTLLLADDSVTIQRVIELTFADEDVRVVAVGDGDKAIARLAGAAPDIVLADVDMPGRDGYAVSAYVRDTPWLRHIPVLLLTSAFEPVDEARVRACGCAGVLVKPFEPQMVIARVRELLDGPVASVPPRIEPPQSRVETPRQPVVAAAPRTVDDYFERLDAAFASLNVPLEPAERLQTARAPAAATPETTATPPEAVPAPQPSEVTSAPPVASGDVVPPPPEPPAFTTAEAFAALLGMERGEPPPPAAARWSPVLGSEAVERIARTVTHEIADRIIRELAPDIVSSVAERLVREEIERLKTLR
jgi:CheY-like chemotaxis protein